MRNSIQPFPQYENEQNSQEKYQFRDQSDDDRKENEREKELEKVEEELEEQSSDWGDVDPAGGEDPTAPGSAVEYLIIKKPLTKWLFCMNNFNMDAALNVF